MQMQGKNSGSSGAAAAQNAEKKDEELKREIFQKAQVVGCTLSTAGAQELMNARVTFESVIIDEASQCTETQAIIPLQFGCKRLILVGDQKQLPSTVFSQLAIHHKFDQSLFERLVTH